MPKQLLLIISFFSSLVSIAGDGAYNVSYITEALLKNAGVVKRMELIEFEISESNSATLRHKVAYTILNEQGDRWAFFQTGYDKLRSISSFEGTLYDVQGNKIKNLKKGDIKDESGMDDASLADDNRVKWHSFFYKVYPYTVEYEVVVKYKGTMFLPDWIPQEKNTMSVQQSRLVISCPSSNPLRFQSYHYENKPVITEEGKNKSYAWEIKNLATLDAEYAAPAWYRQTTSVFPVTEKFSLEDYQGSNASWSDFGKFVYDLKSNRDALPTNIKQKVHELTDNVSNTNEKIRLLYEYMQQNTRYISIQLGVGGWQPFDAKFVAEKKYGDCKALSNFMSALLKEAGIRSLYTVINGGGEKDYLIKELPSSQFNHVILMVPNGKDTVWLECTSQILPAGYLSNFTSDRFALAVDENGGTLVHTPVFGYKENLQIRNINATINETGSLDAQIFTKYRAEQQDRLFQVIKGLSKDKLMEFLKEDVELATYDIKSFHYDEVKKAIPEIKETLELVADNYATVSGKRLFLNPNIISRSHRKLKDNESRKNEIVLGMAYTDIDTTTLMIPDGYKTEAIPQNVTLNTKFGNYQSTISIDGKTIVYIRRIECFNGQFPPTDFDALSKFYETIYKADRAKLVFVKNQ